MTCPNCDVSMHSVRRTIGELWFCHDCLVEWRPDAGDRGGLKSHRTLRVRKRTVPESLTPAGERPVTLTAFKWF